MGHSKKNNPNNSTVALTLIAAGIILILVALILQLYKSLSTQSGSVKTQPAQTGLVYSSESAAQVNVTGKCRASERAESVYSGLNFFPAWIAGGQDRLLDRSGQTNDVLTSVAPLAVRWPAG